MKYYIGLMVVVVIVVALIVNNRKETRARLKEFCDEDADCPKGDKCLQDPETKEKQCFPQGKYFCEIKDPTKLTRCRVNDPNGCSQCLNTPEYSCVVVDKDNPYVWHQNGEKKYLPDSPEGYGWCLPKVDTKRKCNPFTSEYVLLEQGKDSYEWGCFCKYPNLFGHSEGADSDCTTVYACGATDDGVSSYLAVPTDKECKDNSDCSAGDICLRPVRERPCGNDGIHYEGKKYCHTNWDTDGVRDKIDPMAGQCICDPEYPTYQCVKTGDMSFQMNCVQSSCPFGETTVGCGESVCAGKPEKCCKCPKGYIRCPDDIKADAKLCNYCHDTGPTCIKDPCSTEDVPDGYYDRDKQVCVCPGDMNTAMEDEDSPVGQICRQLCKGNGPCGSNGKCYVPEGTTDERCCDCQCPSYSDTSPPGPNRQKATCTCSGWNPDKEGVGGDCTIDSDCCSNNCYTRPNSSGRANQGRCHPPLNPSDELTNPCDAPTCIPYDPKK